jgi:FtsH-binding integral membrane protein
MICESKILNKVYVCFLIIAILSLILTVAASFFGVAQSYILGGLKVFCVVGIFYLLLPFWFQYEDHNNNNPYDL